MEKSVVAEPEDFRPASSLFPGFPIVYILFSWGAMIAPVIIIQYYTSLADKTQAKVQVTR
jgi:hypothetical protein